MKIMKKKVLMLVVGLMTVMATHAQFEEGKIYLGASLSGLDLNYSGSDNLNLGVQAKAGYMCMDNLMLLAQGSYQHYGHDDVPDYMDGIIRIGSVISYDENDNDKNHQDLVDNTEFFDENEIKSFVKERLNIDSTEIIEIIP